MKEHYEFLLIDTDSTSKRLPIVTRQFFYKNNTTVLSKLK